MSIFLPFTFCSPWICWVFLKSREPDSVIFIDTNPDANPVKSVPFFVLKN